MNDVRTWVEIDGKALRRNAESFLALLGPKTRLMAVVKSNAYGHGLVPVAKTLASLKPFEKRGWFGVDSIVEGLRLRREGIENPILVLGHTLPDRLAEAVACDISVSVSNFEALKALADQGIPPFFHIKLDTGMHRQGFLPADVPALIRTLRRRGMTPQGVFTHFASAKDGTSRAYTEDQIRSFLAMSHTLVNGVPELAQNNLLMRHAAASGGALLFPEAHFDMVRIGIGLYGYWPSPESVETFLAPSGKKRFSLTPVLSWKALIAEVKKIPAGALVGYAGTERVERPTTIAVIPIGYWHGYDRHLSGKGEMLIRGKRAKVLGRISMDMTVIDVTDIPGARVGDEVTMIGKQKADRITAEELGTYIGTTSYEVLARINPLIRRITV